MVNAGLDAASCPALSRGSFTDIRLSKNDLPNYKHLACKIKAALTDCPIFVFLYHFVLRMIFEKIDPIFIFLIKYPLFFR